MKLTQLCTRKIIDSSIYVDDDIFKDVFELMKREALQKMDELDDNKIQNQIQLDFLFTEKDYVSSHNKLLEDSKPIFDIQDTLGNFLFDHVYENTVWEIYYKSLYEIQVADPSIDIINIIFIWKNGRQVALGINRPSGDVPNEFHQIANYFLKLDVLIDEFTQFDVIEYYNQNVKEFLELNNKINELQANMRQEQENYDYYLHNFLNIQIFCIA